MIEKPIVVTGCADCPFSGKSKPDGQFVCAINWISVDNGDGEYLKLSPGDCELRNHDLLAANEGDRMVHLKL